MDSSHKLRAGVLTVSDRSSQGLRADASGPELADLLQSLGVTVAWTAVCPDEESEIGKILATWADENRADLILTTGGTGLSPRDVTPEATMSVINREIPGMAEAMRAASMKKTTVASSMPMFRSPPLSSRFMTPIIWVLSVATATIPRYPAGPSA